MVLRVIGGVYTQRMDVGCTIVLPEARDTDSRRRLVKSYTGWSNVGWGEEWGDYNENQ